MKSALLALPLLASTLFAVVPGVSAATSVQASGSVTSSAPSVTPVSAQGDVAIFDISITSTFTGTLVGTSVVTNRCVERVSTGEAHCTGPELFTGTVAGRTGSVQFFDTYFFNVQTGAFAGRSTITGGSADVRGVVNFAGVGATATYSGMLELLP
jgi:Protein of unknown function (DUF3224)